MKKRLSWNFEGLNDAIRGFGGLRIFLFFFGLGGYPLGVAPSHCDHQDYDICSRGFL